MAHCVTSADVPQLVPEAVANQNERLCSWNDTRGNIPDLNIFADQSRVDSEFIQSRDATQRVTVRRWVVHGWLRNENGREFVSSLNPFSAGLSVRKQRLYSLLPTFLQMWCSRVGADTENKRSGSGSGSGSRLTASSTISTWTLCSKQRLVQQQLVLHRLWLWRLLHWHLEDSESHSECQSDSSPPPALSLYPQLNIKSDELPFMKQNAQQWGIYFSVLYLNGISLDWINLYFYRNRNNLIWIHHHLLNVNLE